jgi:Protein of unknown function (DUF4238)
VERRLGTHGESAGICESEILRLAPEVPLTLARELGTIWDGQANAIIERVLEITAESGRVVLPLEGRAEAIGDMARLVHILSIRVVAHRVAGRDPGLICPVEEAANLALPVALRRVQETAKNVAHGFWFQVFDRIRSQRARILPAQPPPWPPVLPGRSPRVRPSGTRRNHYVPKFTSAPWRNDQQRVLQVRRDAGGVISAFPASYTAFGFEKWLYPQQLEDWFGLIENSAAGPFAKLLSADVLLPEDRYFWTSFLITQFIRTPTYFAKSAKELRRVAAVESWPWPMSLDLLRRSHQSIFTQDHVFAKLYERITAMKWRILTTSDARPFPRTDTPAVISLGGGWTCNYPLSPTRCFAAGPDATTEFDVPAALSESIAESTHATLVRRLLRSSRRSFLVRTTDDAEYWKKLAHDFLPEVDPASDVRAWGDFGLTP